MNDKNTKLDLQRKLEAGKEKVAAIDAELKKLELIVGPTNKRISDLVAARRVVASRVAKLVGMLENL